MVPQRKQPQVANLPIVLKIHTYIHTHPNTNTHIVIQYNIKNTISPTHHNTVIRDLINTGVLNNRAFWDTTQIEYIN